MNNMKHLQFSKSGLVFQEEEVRRPAPVQRHLDDVPPGQVHGQVLQQQGGHQGRWDDAGRRLQPVFRPRRNLVLSLTCFCLQSK